MSAIQPRLLERKDVSIRTFGAEQLVIQNLERYAVQLQATTGRAIEVSAWKRDPLGVNIDTVSSELRDLWQAEGVVLIDISNEREEPQNIHRLVGADVDSQQLLEKRTKRGDVAWKTELGWVLSTGSPQTKTASQNDGNSIEAMVLLVSTHGSSLDEQVQTVFELESTTVASPTFPPFASNGGEIGLLRKETARPGDNESQA